MAVVKEFVLVRWLDEDQIGVMPMSAIVKDKAVYVGAVVEIKWKPREVYDAEILKISSKAIISYSRGAIASPCIDFV